MPVVVLTGARQTGKSTLAQAVAPSRRFASLDDFDVLDAARRQPELLLGGAAPATLDEVQRAPDLLREVKAAVDRDRKAGRFLLTGSANLLLMKQVSESLAGRASYLNLWPMTRREQLGLGECGIWDALLDSADGDWPATVAAREARAQDWRELARRGGLPYPAVHMEDAAARAIWFEGYLRTYLERDLLALSAIAGLPDFRRLMRIACSAQCRRGLSRHDSLLPRRERARGRHPSRQAAPRKTRRPVARRATRRGAEVAEHRGEFRRAAHP